MLRKTMKTVWLLGYKRRPQIEYDLVQFESPVESHLQHLYKIYLFISIIYNKMSSSELSNFLANYKTDRSTIIHRPRGLFKTRTSSFLNSIVQALLHIPQFFNLMNDMKNILDKANERVQIIQAFSELADFAQNLTEEEIISGAKYYLRPVRVAKLLNKVVASSKGLFQEEFEEDPVEFLVYLLNEMSYEISSACEDPNFINPIQSTFQGSLEIKPANQKGIDDPFFILPLDISGKHVVTVSDALIEYFNVDGPKESLNTLPEVLIVQLKLFSYDETKGKQKLVKSILTDTKLEIPEQILSEEAINRYSTLQKRYSLSSIIYHQGKTAYNGHYLTVVDHDSLGFLVYEENTMVEVRKGGYMLYSQSNPYLMIFRRKDTFAPYSEQL